MQTFTDYTDEAFMIEKSTEESIILQVLTLADTIKKKGDAICQRLGITTQQWLILLHLANDPNIPYFSEHTETQRMVGADLADALNVSRPNVTNLINSLVQKGLVLQTSNHLDRREKYLSLTEEGQRIVAVIEPYRRQANQKLLEGLDNEEKSKFLYCLSYCLDMLQKT